VEDNVDVGNFAMQSLADLGYVPVLANCAERALAELAADAGRFDVVFSDVVMPGMNGIDLAHRIREHFHDLPVLLASGYSHVLARNGTYGFELLHKPYSIEQLSRLLCKVAAWKPRKGTTGKQL
jgi:DNA-binding NtrC family response regulator